MLSVRALILTVCFAHLIAGSARCRSGGCCDEVCGTYCNEHHACHADDTRCRNVGEACELKNIVQGRSAASAHKNEGKLQSRHVGNATNNKQAKVATFVAQAKAKAQQAKPQAAANAQAVANAQAAADAKTAANTQAAAEAKAVTEVKAAAKDGKPARDLSHQYELWLRARRNVEGIIPPAKPDVASVFGPLGRSAANQWCEVGGAGFRSACPQQCHLSWEEAAAEEEELLGTCASTGCNTCEGWSRNGSWAVEGRTDVRLKHVAEEYAKMQNKDRTTLMGRLAKMDNGKILTWKSAAAAGGCSLPTNTTAANACDILLRMRRSVITIVGDSLASQFYFALRALLGAYTHESMSSGFSCRVCGGRLKLAHVSTWTYPELTEPKKGAKFHAVTQVGSDLVVIMMLAHYHDSKAHKIELLRFAEQFAPWRDLVDLVYTTGTTGHPHCEQFTQPLNSSAEYTARFGEAYWKHFNGKEKTGYSWDKFEEMRCFGRSIYGALGAGILDTNALSRLRPDAHPGHRKGRTEDCLHLFAGPGVPDLWADMLVSYIEAMPMYGAG